MDIVAEFQGYFEVENIVVGNDLLTHRSTSKLGEYIPMKVGGYSFHDVTSYSKDVLQPKAFLPLYVFRMVARQIQVPMYEKCKRAHSKAGFGTGYHVF